MAPTEQRVFGLDAASFVPALRALRAHLQGFDYRFLPWAEFEKTMLRDLSEGMRIYYLELLYRAHFAAATSLLRTDAWIEATLGCTEAENINGFAACFRGFLEAAADSHYTLSITCPSLADCHAIIRQAIAGKLKDLVFAGDLEERLIHFTHARRLDKGETAPASHRAEATTKYLQSLDPADSGRIPECYHQLCNMTHPAAPSLMAFAAISDDGTHFRLEPALAREAIDDFCEEFREVMLQIMSLGVMPAILQLKVINHIAPPQLRTAALERLSLDSRPAWIQLAERLRDPSPPRTLEWQTPSR